MARPHKITAVCMTRCALFFVPRVQPDCRCATKASQAFRYGGTRLKVRMLDHFCFILTGAGLLLVGLIAMMMCALNWPLRPDARLSLSIIGSPEHLFPAQIDDVAAVWSVEAADGRQGIAIGDSAGGNLSAGLCFRMRRTGGPMPLAQVLIYPGLGGDMDAPSYIDNAEAPMLRTQDLKTYAGMLTGGDMELRRSNPEISPLVAQSFAGLPPAFIVTADIDPLRDDGPAYLKALQAEGIDAEWRNEPQLIHGYLRARHSSARAAESFRVICNWINAFLAR